MKKKKSFPCIRDLCIYRTLLAARKRRRTAILSTEHSLFFLLFAMGNVAMCDSFNREVIIANGNDD